MAYSTLATGYSSNGALRSLTLRSKTTLNGPLIFCLHGRGGDATQYLPWGAQQASGPGAHAYALAEAGFTVVALDTVGLGWGNATQLSYLNEAVTNIAAGRSYGFMAWSMGAAAALNYMVKYPAANLKSQWLWSAMTDLDWAAAQGAWTAEINAAYGGSYAGSNGNTYRIRDSLATFQGSAVPIRVAHATDDATVPSTQTDSFVSLVNRAGVTKRTVDTGGHVSLFGSVPTGEVVSFFKSTLT